MKINLHIDQLTLHGFDRMDRRQVEAAVRSELSRLLGEQGLPSSLHQSQAIGNINAGEFRSQANAGTNAVGFQIAQQIYQGMKR